MPLVIDWDTHIIGITSPTTEVDGQTLHDFIEDNMATPEGILHNDIINPEGKIEDPANPGVYSQIIIMLNSPWQIQFWGGSGYTRLYGAKIVGGLNDEPAKATGTAGDLTILESPVDGLTIVPGSTVTQQDKDDIIEGVWKALFDENSDPDTMGGIISDIIKMVGYRITRSGDIITIFEKNGVTIWRQYNLVSGGRVQL